GCVEDKASGGTDPLRSITCCAALLATGAGTALLPTRVGPSTPTDCNAPATTSNPVLALRRHSHPLPPEQLLAILSPTDTASRARSGAPTTAFGKLKNAHAPACPSDFVAAAPFGLP